MVHFEISRSCASSIRHPFPVFRTSASLFLLPLTGRHNVMYGMSLVNGDDPVVRQIIDYQFTVLDALNIRYGGGHGEVMLTPTGPCLVEVGARTAGCAGCWLPIAENTIGYSSVQMWADVLLNLKKFEGYPKYPVWEVWFPLCHPKHPKSTIRPCVSFWH